MKSHDIIIYTDRVKKYINIKLNINNISLRKSIIIMINYSNNTEFSIDINQNTKKNKYLIKNYII